MKIKGRVGIVDKGIRGETIALFFARHGYQVEIFETDPKRAKEFLDGTRKKLEIKDLTDTFVKVPIEAKRMHWVKQFNQLSGCDLFIEALPDDLDVKQKYISKLETLAQDEKPILSDTILYMPTLLSAQMRDNSRFVVAYFYDIEYTVNTVELVYHQDISHEILEKIKAILRDAGFDAFALRECPGFIHNRVGCIGIQNLLRLYDQNILSFQNLGRYFISTRFEPYILNVPMLTEISMEIYDFIPLFKALNKEYGSRFYLPKFLAEDLTKENLVEKISRSSSDYFIREDDMSLAGKNSGGQIRNIFISGIRLIHNNMIYPLLRKNKRLYFDSLSTGYFQLLKRQNPKLSSKLQDSRSCMANGSVPGLDLIIDFKIEPLEQKIETVRKLQERFGPEIPILLNTPVYRIKDIAAEALNADMIFGMYTQKNYLKNTELVVTPLMNKTVYINLRCFIEDIATAYIETRDTYIRPLIAMVVPKMLESVRILEEGIADMRTIETLGVDRRVFKDMDLMGLDKIVFLCEYLQPIYGDAFAVPESMRKMLKEGRSGFSAGHGFYQY